MIFAGSELDSVSAGAFIISMRSFMRVHVVFCEKLLQMYVFLCNFMFVAGQW